MTKYRMVKQIGKGTFGRVYLVREEKTKELFCMKAMNKWKKITKGSMREIFSTEVEALKKMNHKNVIKYVDHFETKNHFYIVMEYAKDGELFNLAASKRISEKEARDLFLQIIYGVKHIHKMGYFHRDLKLENILLDDSVVKICDFGLAAKKNGKEKAKGDVGSPNYASPQVINDQPYDGVKNDIWNLGVILFVLCSGKYPFGNDLPIKELFRVILKKDPPLYMMRFVDVDLDMLVKDLLEKNEKNRILFERIKENTWLNKQGST